MPDDDAATALTPAPIPGPTPTGYQRTQGGGVKWLPPSTEQLSRLLPQYDIECLLGRGGMGAVYKGTQKSLKRAVAIKILPPEVDDEDASYTERFKNEAQILARLSHPGIVAVHDFGETSEGQLYIVMEFIDGSDVSQMIAAQGRLPPEHALAIAAHVCDALRYAHEHGVVHRDIKPANILINMEGAVKVADFGLAKLDEPGASGLTKTGMAMGTPDYVAPEALVMGVQVDGRADLYAVGVMLYHMLTGSVPRGAFDPPSKRLGTDPRFDAIIQKAMQMDRESRYQSSAEIRRDLDVILTMPLVQSGGKSSAAIPRSAGAPTRQPPSPSPRSTPKPAGDGTRVPVPPAKSKTPLFLGLGAAAVIGIGAFVMWPAQSSVRSGSKAPEPAQGTVRTTPSAPAKAIEPPKPAPVFATATAPKPETPKPAPEKKADPKPSISASPSLPASKSSVPSSPPPQVTSSSPQFPPGQWVKLFTKFEDLPVELRKPDSGVKFEDGWIRMKQRATFSIPAPLTSNYGVKLRFIRDDVENSSHAQIRIREQSSKSNYGVVVGTRELVCTLNQGTQATKVFGAVPPAIPKAGEKGELEFFVVGSRLIGRTGGSFVASGYNDLLKQGPAAIVGIESIRDIEVINLDGIPEAEALRIIGVDEKGNDTRVAAFAAEKQAMEQKQVAQAAASIPELAALDEQLKKLTAERVTAPFEAEVAKLNSGYLGGLDRKMAEEKAAGHLDGVLAIEEEKKRVADKQPIPSAEDDATSTTTPAVLKGLRQIYREAYAKIEATRAANLKALTDPLTTRLKTLESDLTKKDRIADAKTVKEYREGLASRSGGLQPPSPSPSGSAPPAPTPAVGNTPLFGTALKDGFTNSLGMKFVPVKGTDVLFCIHETRYKDYAAFAAEMPGVGTSWKDQSASGFTPTENTEDHPVMKVNWGDAQAFCAWLSKKEGKTYRLPTDREWSIAAGLGRDEKWKQDTTPATVFRNKTDFPWGDKWPPPKGSGNYSDQSCKDKARILDARYIDGYDDGFPTTATAMSFKPNKMGLYDLGGNVWEWCEDWYDNEKKLRVSRGGAWNTFAMASLLSAYRSNVEADYRSNSLGFRIVLETRNPSTPTKPTPTTTPPPPIVPPPAPAPAAKSDFSNSLGMKFVKVPGTQVLFCIHETRRQDYAVYAAAVAGVQEVNTLWRDQNKDGIPISDKDDHPVVSVNWDDANAFSTWLSKKEGRKYRLPTDKEWSFAVGIGRDEKWTKDSTPEMRHSGLAGVFPWNGDYPPSTKDQAGNYADSSWHDKFPDGAWMEGYTDGFPTTSPVMSFKPNKQGIYDLGGNVWEWCEDLFNPATTDRLIRGGAYSASGSGNLRSSDRHPRTPATRGNDFGFRIVVEMTAP